MAKRGVTFQPDSLAYLSQVEICKRLWTHSKIKNSLIVKLEEEDVKIKDQSNDLSKRCVEDKLTNQVCQNIDKLHLPLFIKSSLKILANKMSFVIWEFLDKIYDGCNILVDAGEYIDLNCLDHLKWTKDGDIDLAETARAMYQSQLFPDDNNTWLKLTSYCLEDCIIDYYQRTKPLKFISSELLESSSILSIYWACRMEKRLDDIFTELRTILSRRDFYQESEAIEMNLLRLFIEERNYAAIKYFWQLLDNDQRIRIIHKYVNNWNGTMIINAETAVFLLKDQIVSGIDEFFIKILGEHTIMRQLVEWPHESLLMRLLEEAWNHYGDADLQKMVDAICRTIFRARHERKVQCRRYKEYLEIFMGTWQRINDNYKQSMDCFTYVSLFRNNVDILKFIFDDPALRIQKNSLLSRTAFMLVDVADEFSSIVLESDEQRQEFNNQMNRRFPPRYCRLPVCSRIFRRNR